MPAGNRYETKSERVVIHFGTELIKVYLESKTWNTIEDLLQNAPSGLPATFCIRRVGSDIVDEIRTEKAKAIFYVDNFEGDLSHNPLQFHSRAPIVHGVWIRVEFLDGEIMEGIVHNSIRYLVDPGFFMEPSDPGSNNKLVYVMKSWLKDYRVLGVRKL